MRRITLLAAGALAAAGVLAGSSGASAPPVGPLPKSPVTTIHTVVQELVAIALPRGRSGLVWRAAPPYDPTVVRPYAEQDIAKNLTILVYLAVAPGTAHLNFGLTNDEQPKVYRAARYAIVVGKRR
jgi:hypothetical protein